MAFISGKCLLAAITDIIDQGFPKRNASEEMLWVVGARKPASVALACLSMPKGLMHTKIQPLVEVLAHSAEIRFLLLVGFFVLLLKGVFFSSKSLDLLGIVRKLNERKPVQKPKYDWGYLYPSTLTWL